MENKDIENAKSLIGLLRVKINEEYKLYITSLYDKPAHEIIDEAYKITYFKEFKEILENDTLDYLDETEIELLLHQKNLLETLYEDWLCFDAGEMDMYRDFVFGYWNWELLSRRKEENKT